MKKLMFFTMLLFPFLSIGQTFDIGIGTTIYHEDNVKDPVNGMKNLPALEIRYVHDLSPYHGDNHRMIVWGKVMGEFEKTREGTTSGFDYRGIQAGFAFHINAIPIIQSPDTDIGFFFGGGFEYDSYWNSADFLPQVIAYAHIREFNLEIGVDFGLIEGMKYGIVPEYHFTFLYDLIKLGKYR